MAGKYTSLSPYSYCAENPVNMVDLDGNMIIPWPIQYMAYAASLEKSNNPRHKSLGYSMQNPVIALKVGRYSSWMRNISTVSVNYSVNIARTAGLTLEPEGSHSNALRHTIWQALITKDFGVDQAIRIGMAHESNIKVYKTSGFETKGSADNVADLLNNEIGRQIGKGFQGSNYELILSILDQFRDKGLWVVQELDDGTYTVNLETISSEQYDKGMIELNKLNKYGKEQ